MAGNGQPYSRRRILTGAGSAGLASLAGCATVRDALPGSSDDGDSDAAGDGSDDDRFDDNVRADANAYIGMVYSTGGLDDKSFNDLAHRGVQRMKLEQGVSFAYREPSSPEEMPGFQQEFAESTSPDYDLVCSIGFDQVSGLEENADEFPDQRFAIVDSVLDMDNVASYAFKEHQGSFLGGYLAAGLTSRDIAAGSGETRSDASTVGFVGGIETEVIRRFEAGFLAGVDHHEADVDVLTEYVGGFGDIEGGKAAAERMYDEGADIVYHAAGGTGLGVFQAAQERGRFALGVDSDQSRSNPRYSDVIVASMTKQVDTAVSRAIASVLDDSFQGGSVVELGLEADGVALVYGNQLGSAVPNELQGEIVDVRESIVSGDIEVPRQP